MKIRFAVTHVNQHGIRQLSFANQGRNHFDTEGACRAHILAMIRNNSAQTLASIYGPNVETLEARAVECYDHGDAIGIYFDGYSPERDQFSAEEQKKILAKLFKTIEPLDVRAD